PLFLQESFLAGPTAHNISPKPIFSSTIRLTHWTQQASSTMFTSLMWVLFGLAYTIVTFAYIALVLHTLLVTLQLVVPMISPVILDEGKIEALGCVLMELALMALLYDLYRTEAGFRDYLDARLRWVWHWCHWMWWVVIPILHWVIWNRDLFWPEYIWVF
ncbi:hypothetical protein V8F06_008630, partial [Rhypophila decipiens]